MAMLNGLNAGALMREPQPVDVLARNWTGGAFLQSASVDFLLKF